MIFDDTTAYNHYFEGRGDVIWHHFGTVFPEGCRGRLFCDFLMFFGCPGSRCGAPGRPLGHLNFGGLLPRFPVWVGDPKSAESGW